MLPFEYQQGYETQTRGSARGEPKTTEIDKSCEILSSVDRVWELISDADKDEAYWGAIKDIKVIKRDGNSIEREAMVGPRAFARKSTQTIVLDPKKSIQLTMTGEGMTGERKIVLVPLGKNSTRVDVTWEIEVKDVPGFVQGIVRGQLAKATEDALKKFKKEAESVATSTRGQVSS
jgi:ribosome-associated toxin RatA of RatAB toxin-antitoxin module